MILACLRASHSTRMTTRRVTAPFRPAPSATVANSSSASATDPVRRTLTPLSAVKLSLEIASRIEVVALPPGSRASKSRTGWMSTKRRSSEGFGARPVISLRHEKAGLSPFARRSRASAMATTAGLRSSSSAFPRRTPSIDCDKVRRTPRSVGSAASVPRKGWALISSAVSRRTSSTERKRTPLRAKNSPPSGRLMLRITSERGERSLTSASAASSAASGVVASTTAMIWLVDWGNALSSMISCWRHGSELERSSLLSVVMAKWLARKLAATIARSRKPEMTSHAWRLDRRTARVMASIVAGLPILRMGLQEAPV